MKWLTYLAVLSMFGCAHLTPVEQKLVDCGTSAVTSQLPSLVPQVAPILQGQGPNIDWQQDLTNLIQTAGDAGICAIEVAIQTFGGKSGSAMDPMMQKASVRGYLYLEQHGYQTKNVKPLQ